MRKLMSLALALVMSLALAAPAAAADVGTSGSTGSVPVTISAEATTFSVTVPTSIPLNVDANAAVTCADNLKIINNSAGPVEVTAIAVQNNAWSIVSFNGGNRSSLASEKVNSNKLGLALTPDGGTQIATATTDNQNLTPVDGEWVIPAGGNLPFECAGIATAVSESASNVQAAKVVFTLAWKDAGPTLISFTIDSTSYQAEEGMTWLDWITSEYNIDGYINVKNPQTAGMCGFTGWKSVPNGIIATARSSSRSGTAVGYVINPDIHAYSTGPVDAKAKIMGETNYIFGDYSD